MHKRVYVYSKLFHFTSFLLKRRGEYDILDNRFLFQDEERYQKLKQENAWMKHVNQWSSKVNLTKKQKKDKLHTPLCMFGFGFQGLHVIFNSHFTHTHFVSLELLSKSACNPWLLYTHIYTIITELKEKRGPFSFNSLSSLMTHPLFRLFHLLVCMKQTKKERVMWWAFDLGGIS